MNIMSNLDNSKVNAGTFIPSEQAAYLYKKHVRGAYARSGAVFLIGTTVEFGVWSLEPNREAEGRYMERAMKFFGAMT